MSEHGGSGGPHEREQWVPIQFIGTGQGGVGGLGTLMKLWLIEPVSTLGTAWDPWYDKAFGFVVRAVNESDARSFAAGEHGDEGPDVWRDPAMVSCVELTNEGDQGVVLRDFRAA